MPGETRKWRQHSAQAADLFFADPQQAGQDDRQDHADEGSGQPGRETRRNSGGNNHHEPQEQRRASNTSQIVEHNSDLLERGAGRAGRRGGDPQDDVHLGDEHHAADPAREARHHGVRDPGNVASQPENAEAHHEDRSHQANFGGAADPLAARRSRDKRDGGAGGAADQYGVAAQQRDERRRKNRRKDTQDRRQPHQGCHREAVRQRDQRCDHASRSIPEKLLPAVVTCSKGSFSDEGLTNQAITLRKAVLNLFISSWVPIETRT